MEDVAPLLHKNVPAHVGGPTNVAVAVAPLATRIHQAKLCEVPLWFLTGAVRNVFLAKAGSSPRVNLVFYARAWSEPVS